jgi:acetolactate synthase-1/2/3 large subunit
MKVEEYIAERLRREGVRRFYGIPGGPSIAYMEAFRKAGIEFILTCHEASAAVMADVTARLTGVTGVCHATFGPGAVNLASGTGGALLDRSPVLALTSEMPDSWLGRTAQMNIDQQALFRPLTKATFRLNRSNAPEVISRSLELANEEYPGPVHIGLPSDLAGTDARPFTVLSGAGVEPVQTSDALAKGAELVASSDRAVIAAGLTAVRTGAGSALLKFLDDHVVPVVVTPMAKGIIPDDHPCFAGVLFHALSDRLEKVLREADLVIGLGYDPVEYNYESWLPEAPLVHLDTRPHDLRIRGAIQIVSPSGRWFEYLECLRSSPDMIRLASGVRSEILREIHDRDSGFSPVTALSVLRQELPADTIVTADVGSHLHLLGQFWDVMAGRLIMTNGWSSMGFGLPAAVAAAMTGVSDTVVCVTGDGGFLMHAGEIMTARRYGLRIITVVLSDGELNLIRVKQSWQDVKPYGIKVCDGPLFNAGSFLGVDVIRVTDAGELRSAVRRSLNSGGSIIIEAAIDPSLYSELIVKTR